MHAVNDRDLAVKLLALRVLDLPPDDRAVVLTYVDRLRTVRSSRSWLDRRHGHVVVSIAHVAFVLLWLLLA